MGASAVMEGRRSVFGFGAMRSRFHSIRLSYQKEKWTKRDPPHHQLAPAHMRVDSSQSPHATSASGGSRISSKTSRSSAPSSLTIPSFSDTSSTGCLPTPRTEGEILSSPNLKPFTFNELKNATRNFRPDSLLGEGGFGYVFKGWLDEHTLSAAKPGSGMVVAVKKLKPEGFQGHKEWLVGFVL
ncbi:hypothetical protein CCACVL1_06593 [Corchorus capsularis]|uniref:Protein kinase domain-containing protein n=1 Tax=Corchorus capsularis TaxID=210143 RepID=A0A1R3JED9_COCAP|nr:hypothetical protein CCACVL1_06593 [Corchorus capsularis]